MPTRCQALSAVSASKDDPLTWQVTMFNFPEESATYWLARFRRRSIVVSKAKRMVDASIALFARFGGNDKIQDLLSMLA